MASKRARTDGAEKARQLARVVRDLLDGAAHPARLEPAGAPGQKTAGPYRRREFVAFQHDLLHTPNTTRPPLLEERFAQLGTLLAETLQLDPEGSGE